VARAPPSHILDGYGSPGKMNQDRDNEPFSQDPGLHRRTSGRADLIITGELFFPEISGRRVFFSKHRI